MLTFDKFEKLQQMLSYEKEKKWICYLIENDYIIPFEKYNIIERMTDEDKALFEQLKNMFDKKR